MHAIRLLIVAALAWTLAAGCANALPPPRDFSPDAIPDAFRLPTAALAHPLATRSILVSSGGHLYNGEWWTRIEASSDGLEASAPRAIAFEDRWLPVARWTRNAGPIRFDFEAVALPGPGSWTEELTRPITRAVNAQIDAREHRTREALVQSAGLDRVDELVARAARVQKPRVEDRRNLLVSLAVRVTHHGRGVHATRLGVTLAAPGADPPFIALDRNGSSPEAAWVSARDVPGTASADSVLGWSELPARRTRAETAWVLGPGESRVTRFVLPAYPIDPRVLERWASVPHALRIQEARGYWISEVDRGASFELDDPPLESAIRAARVVLLSCRERRDGRWLPIGGPFHNRDVYLPYAARAVQALVFHGYVREARGLVSAFDEWQWPHGPFVSQKSQLDGTGQALWAYAQAFLRPTPDPAVGHYAEAARQAVAWCERQRARSTEAVSASVSWNGNGGPAIAADGTVAGLMPAADPKDNELVHGQLVGTDSWAIAGYRAAAELLEAAGRREDAAAVRLQLGSYRALFAQSLATLGHADVPPSWSGTGLEWGNLAVGYPCRALPATDPRLAALAHRYWTTAGAVGLGYYGTPSLHHGYVAADLGSWALMTGRREEAERMLDSLVYWRNASGAGAELFTRDGDFGINLPPHPTSAAALLTLARNSLVFDESDTLTLTAGARARWWNGARVRRLPTRWGTLDLEFRIRGGRAEWRWTPVPVWTALTLPPGTVPRGALPRPLLPGSRPDLVLAPPGIGRAQVEIGSLPVSVRWE